TTLSTCLVALLVTLDQASDWGWGDGRIIALEVISVIGLLAFIATQRRAGGDALVPPGVIRNRSFAAACLTITLVSGIWFVTTLFAAVARTQGEAGAGFVAGLHAALRVGAAIGFVGLVTVWWIVRRPTQSDAVQAADSVLAQ